MSKSKLYSHPYFKDLPGAKKMKVDERTVHLRVVKHLREYHQGVRFYTTLDGEYFGKFQASHIRNLQWGKGVPDLLIFHKTPIYSGLAIELKTEDARLYKKNGDLYKMKGDHLQHQHGWIEYLKRTGWHSDFAQGDEAAIQLIEDYFSGKTF